MKNAAVKVLSNENIFMFNIDRLKSSEIIQKSRVNQILCDEAEAGRAHGNASIYNGCLITGDGTIVIHLNTSYCLQYGDITSSYPFDLYTGGEPLIEGLNVNYYGTNTSILNGKGFPWNTGEIYLRASVSSNPQFFQNDNYCLKLLAIENQQVKALGKTWNLSGDWGEQNRLREGNWHFDDSILTTKGDSNAFCHIVKDETNIAQYVIELLSTGLATTLLLPYRYLKRPNFIGPRRVFFAPEENIAIWGADKIIQPDVTDVIISFDPGIMFLNYPNHITPGCIPGGVSAIAKTNFAPLRGKQIHLMLFNQENKEEVNYVLKCLAKLRKNDFPVQCLKVNGNTYDGEYILPNKAFWGTYHYNCKAEKIEIEQLRKLANQHNIFIPDELSSDFRGDITEIVKSRKEVSVATDVFNLGDIVLLNTQDKDIASKMITHFARSIGSGTAIFPKLWHNNQFNPVVFVDHLTDPVAKYLCRSGVPICDSRFIDASAEDWPNDFKFLVKTAQVVFFAGYDVWDKPERFIEVIRWCRDTDRAVVVLSIDDTAIQKKLRSLISQKIDAKYIDGGDGINIGISVSGATSVAARFNPNGELINAEKLSPGQSTTKTQAIPSKPYNEHKYDNMKNLPVEKRHAAIEERNKLKKTKLPNLRDPNNE